MQKQKSIKSIPITEIHPDPTQPRKSFTGIEELAASIATHGLDQPISVRKTGGTYTIVTGEWRWQAHKLAGLKDIECIVVKNSTTDDVFLSQMRENMSRQDMTVQEEIQAVKQAVDRGYPIDELADGLGRSHKYVNELYTLSSNPAVVEALSKGKIGKTVALEVVTGDKPKAALKAALKAGGSTRQAKANLRKLEKDAKGKSGPKNDDTPKDKPSPSVEAKRALQGLMRAVKRYKGTDTAAAVKANASKMAEMTEMVKVLRDLSNELADGIADRKAVINQ